MSEDKVSCALWLSNPNDLESLLQDFGIADDVSFLTDLLDEAETGSISVDFDFEFYV